MVNTQEVIGGATLGKEDSLAYFETTKQDPRKKDGVKNGGYLNAIRSRDPDILMFSVAKDTSLAPMG